MQGIAYDRSGQQPSFKLWVGDLSEQCTDHAPKRFLATRIQGAWCIDGNVQGRATCGRKYAITAYRIPEEGEAVGWNLLRVGTVHCSGNIIPMRVERYPNVRRR